MTARWTEAGSTRTAPIESATDAIDLFDDLNTRLRSAPSMVEMSRSDDGGSPAFTIGAGRELTVLGLQSSLDPPYFMSAGNADAVGGVWFLYAVENTEVAAFNLVELDVGRRALAEFIETERLPTSVSWEEL